MFYNHKNIENLIFTGYKDDEEERFMEVYHQWEKDLTVKKVKM
nr:DUF4176 domain-containing protein [Streptococcus marimammalium]